MLDWATINPAIEGLFASLAFPNRTPEFMAQWDGRGQKFTHSGTQTNIALKIASIAEVGEDETRIVTIDIEGTPTQVYAQLGNRRIVLNIRVESHNNTDTTWAWQTVEKIRTRLRRPASLEALSALNMGLISTGPSVAVPVTRDGREWSIASLDVNLSARFCDPEDVSYGWIESVRLTSRVEDETGVVMGEPPNGTVLIDSNVPL